MARARRDEACRVESNRADPGTSFVGKVLGDATTVGQHNIKEKDFLVVMVTKVSTPAGGYASCAPVVVHS